VNLKNILLKIDIKNSAVWISPLKCLFALLFLLTTLPDRAQTIDLTQKINIVQKNAPLELVLNDIESKTGIKFSYSTQTINPAQKVTVVGRKKQIGDILKLLFSDLNIEYVLVEKQIVLKKKFSLPNESPVKKEKTEKFTLSGFVRNADDGEALIGAAVSVLNSSTGCSANEFGFYSLNLPKGKYVLRYSYIGHADIDIEIDLHEDLNQNVQLKTDITEIEIIVVTENQYADALEKNASNNIKINERQLNSYKGLAGETDVVKTVMGIPGINSFSEGSVMFYVRGGAKDENLIMIDDAPIYNPAHLFGFFSSVSPDAVNDLKVYKNSFPVKYGGRLSSVTDIRTKDGNMQKWGFSATISPFTGNWSFDGPLKKERSSVFFNLRNAHLNWLLKNTNNQIDFYDLHVKWNTKIKKKSRLFFSFYSGKDDLKTHLSAFGNGGLSWQNNAMSLRWNKLYSEKLFSNLTFHTGKYDYFLYYNLEDNLYWNAFIGNLSFKNDFTYYISPGNQFDFGVNGNIYFFNPGNLNNDYFSRTVYAGNATEYVLYAGRERSFGNKFRMSVALRVMNWNNHGPSVIFKFDDNFNVTDTLNFPQGSFNQFLNAEPRLALYFAPDRSLSFKLTFDRHIQYLHILSNSISPFTTPEVPMPSGPNIQPLKSLQFTAGVYKWFWETEWTAEFWYKSMQNVIEYKEHANMLLNPYVEGELRFGKGRAYGLECMAQKKKGNFNFSTAYTYSRVFHTIPAINNGEEYPARYDMPHNFKAGITYNRNGRWLFNSAWVYASGMRFSSPSAYFDYNGYTLPIYSKKNNDRLPDYHRLDLSVTLNLNIKESAHLRHEFTLAIYNLYGRKNYIAVNFNKIETVENTYVVPSNLIAENELLETAKYISVMMPSLSYALKFR
jgi:hypothetical protein